MKSFVLGNKTNVLVFLHVTGAMGIVLLEMFPTVDIYLSEEYSDCLASYLCGNEGECILLLVVRGMLVPKFFTSLKKMGGKLLEFPDLKSITPVPRS